MQPQFRFLMNRGWPGTRNCSLPPMKLVVVAAGGVSGRPLPYCRKAPIFQSLTAFDTSLLLNHFCVTYRMLALNRNGWSVGSSDFTDGTKRMGRMAVSALDQVNVPLTCKPCDIRLVPFI